MCGNMVSYRPGIESLGVHRQVARRLLPKPANYLTMPAYWLLADGAALLDWGCYQVIGTRRRISYQFTNNLESNTYQYLINVILCCNCMIAAVDSSGCILSL